MYSHHRRHGYEKALRFASLDPDPELIVEEDLTEEGDAAGVRKTLPGEIQAEFFVCDQNPTQFSIEHGVCDSHDVGDD